MSDVHDAATRSRNMKAIRGKDTKPELLIRRGLHARGFRYLLHSKRLPGKPDLVFPKYRAVIFINGCFWHLHDCPLFKWPATRRDFWREKLTKTRKRDLDTVRTLRAEGWRVLTVWECVLKGTGKSPMDTVLDTVTNWLRSNDPAEECRETDSMEQRSNQESSLTALKVSQPNASVWLKQTAIAHAIE